MLDCSSGAPLAKGARLSALHRSIFRSFGPALFVGRLFILRLLRAQWRCRTVEGQSRSSVSELLAPGRGAGERVSQAARVPKVTNLKARRAAPCSIRQTSPVDAPREQGGGSMHMFLRTVKDYRHKNWHGIAGMERSMI